MIMAIIIKYAFTPYGGIVLALQSLNAACDYHETPARYHRPLSVTWVKRPACTCCAIGAVAWQAVVRPLHVQ